MLLNKTNCKTVKRFNLRVFSQAVLMFSFVHELHLLLPHPPCNPTDTCCEICLLCARAAQSARKKCKKKCGAFFLHSFELAVLRASSQVRPLVQSLTGAGEVWRRGDDRSAVRRLAAAGFPSLCSTRRNMALIHDPSVAPDRSCSCCHR